MSAGDLPSLPERLRAEIERTVYLDILHHDAANEIERLQAELAQANKFGADAHTAAAQWMEKANALRAEVEALRAKLVPLTDEQIELGRRETFSTDNPFCPCTAKTMHKAVRWAERAHGIDADRAEAKDGGA